MSKGRVFDGLHVTFKVINNKCPSNFPLSAENNFNEMTKNHSSTKINSFLSQVYADFEIDHSIICDEKFEAKEHSLSV